MGFRDATTSQLKHIRVDGGAAVVIGPATNPYGVSWEADGTILFGQVEGILRVSANGGTPEVVIAAAAGEALDGPRLLPDGESVLFTVTPSTTQWDKAEIVVESLRTHVRTPSGLTGRDARHVSTGHLVYAFEDSLFAVAFDVDRLTVEGDTAAMVQGVRGASVSTGAAFFEVATTGALVYLPGASSLSRTLVWADRAGQEEPINAPPDAYQYPRISPDGTRLALAMSNSAAMDIWTWDLAREILNNVTTSAASERYALWTPAGDRIVFSSDRDWKCADMPEFTITRQINAPVETVWEILDDFGDIQRWSPGVKASQLTSPGPVSEGSKRHCDFAPFGSVNERIDRHEPNQRLTVDIYEAFKLPISGAVADFNIAPHDDGTELTLHYSYTPNLLGRVLKGYTDTQMRKGIGGMANALQRESERLAASRA